jgi:hypothetical protein
MEGLLKRLKVKYKLWLIIITTVPVQVDRKDRIGEDFRLAAAGVPEHCKIVLDRSSARAFP